MNEKNNNKTHRKGIRRSNHIGIRLTAEERAIVESKAEKAGLPLSAYLRRAAVQASITPLSNITELNKCTTEISRIGNNLNQLARAFNSGKDIHPQTLIDTAGAIHEALMATLQHLRKTKNTVSGEEK